MISIILREWFAKKIVGSSLVVSGINHVFELSQKFFVPVIPEKRFYKLKKLSIIKNSFNVTEKTFQDIIHYIVISK